MSQVIVGDTMTPVTKREQRTLYLRGDLWKRLRMQALREDSSASKIIERLVEEYLRKKER
jgi:hypothetical protein